jgi:hypothetical protein
MASALSERLSRLVKTMRGQAFGQGGGHGMLS